MSAYMDHRQLADEMEIFFFDSQIGAGLPVWLPNGVAIRDSLEAFVKELERREGYQRVVSPHLAKAELYARSGHLAHYKDDMFPPMQWKEGEEQQSFYLKPMNCPHHHKVFSASPRSYKALPLRIAEYGQVYRYEPSGSMRGLSRVRGLCQNDAHIYVDPDVAFDEIVAVLKLHERCYKAIGLSGHRYRLSKSDSSKPGDFQGDPKLWIQCEEILRRALLHLDLPFFESVGEAAFYGPKIDIQMSLGGNEESISSVQLDFVSAANFGLRYSARSGESLEPWIIHRAPLGSHERFVAMLLEFFEGRLPGWLAPVQVALIPVSENEREFLLDLREKLLCKGIRVDLVDASGSLAKRVLFAHRSRPFAKVIVGQKEVAEGKLKIHLRDRIEEASIDQISQILLKLIEVPAV